MYAIIYLALLCATVQEVTAACPDGFIRHENSCYRLFHNKFTWPEASSFCRSYNTHLLYLETESEFGFIKARAAEIGGEGFWTGATDALTENEWIWNETGERLALTSDWAPGEPDHAVGRDCLGLWGKNGFKLSAWDCRHLLGPICETDADNEGQGIIG
ncbi:perlucin-like [Mizuhopecten yessoensis]|uniref:Perlucin n=1 Tax=Mizuhopecten yessoensis TaxID=6573 RepID=A0A210PRZ0_MIZYE|nr:perlucin-like [Mizuhopecten yessoensis]OWF39260.1 Perlucin [Mizuhopecten yessoensis]